MSPYELSELEVRRIIQAGERDRWVASGYEYDVVDVAGLDCVPTMLVVPGSKTWHLHCVRERNSRGEQLALYRRRLE